MVKWFKLRIPRPTLMRDQIIILGSLNQDLVVNLRRFPEPGQTVTGQSMQTFCGGKGANQAFAVGRLGGRAIMIGQVGDDAAGQAQIQSLSSAGVNVDHLRRIPSQCTGTAVIAVDASGENRIIIVPGANGSFSPDAVEPCAGLIAGAAALLVQLEVPLETVARAIAIARAGGARIILDPAPAPTQALPDAILSGLDYLTPNLTELACLTGDSLSEDADEARIVTSARKLCARGVRTVIAKLGSRGAIVVSAQAFEPVPAFRVSPVDTTAAGDCFNGAFATALVSGASELNACRFAAAAAAVSVTRAGAQAGMPSRDEVRSMMGESRC